MEDVPVIEMAGPPAVAAGWPSPAEDYAASLDLNEHLMPRPTSTFILRVAGWSMQNASISDGDEVLVDRALRAGDGSIVVAVLHDEFTLKRLRTSDPPRLEAAAPDHPDIPIGEDGIELWGVVTTVIHHVR